MVKVLMLEHHDSSNNPQVFWSTRQESVIVLEQLFTVREVKSPDDTQLLILHPLKMYIVQNDGGYCNELFSESDVNEAVGAKVLIPFGDL